MDINPAPGNLPPKAKRMLEHVYKDRRAARMSKARASEVAWGVVKKSYQKRGGRWLRRKKDKEQNPPAPTLPSRVMKRSPVGEIDDMDAAELGSMLELEVNGHEIVWHRGEAALVWSPDKRTLFILEGGRRRKAKQLETGSRAARAFERWAGRGAKREGAVDIDPRGRWRSFGSVRRIDYTSDKRGRRGVDYTHSTGRGVRLYRLGSATQPPWVWAIKGGRLSVTTRGIVG